MFWHKTSRVKGGVGTNPFTFLLKFPTDCVFDNRPNPFKLFLIYANINSHLVTTIFCSIPNCIITPPQAQEDLKHHNPLLIHQILDTTPPTCFTLYPPEMPFFVPCIK